MAKELTTQQWLGELERGSDYRRDFGLEDEWSKLEAMFYSVEKYSTAPNLVASNGDALISNMSMSNPYITVSPTNIYSVPACKILERLDNVMLDDIHLPEEVETAALHAFLWCKGIIKIGYDSEFGWDPKYIAGQREELGLSLTQFDLKGRRIESGMAKPGMPWVSACCPQDIIVPWGARSDQRLPWIAHRIVRHIDDIKADPKYSGKRDLQPTISMSDYVHSYLSRVKPMEHKAWRGQALEGSGSEQSQFVELYEIHDARDGKIKVMAIGHDKWLRNDTDYMQLDGLPFVSFSFVPRTRSYWTTPDAHFLVPYQAELTDIALQAAKQRRIDILKILYKAGKIEQDYIDKMMRPDVAPFIPVKDDGAPLQDAFHVLNMPNRNFSLYQDADVVMRNARSTVGFSRNEMGEYESKGRRTATETIKVSQGSETRLSRRRLVIARVYQEVIKKVNAAIFEYWGAPRWIEVMKDGGSQWMNVSGKDLKGDYRYTVTLSDEPLRTRQAITMEALQIYSVLSRDPMVNQVELRNMLVDSFQGERIDKIFGGIQGAPLSVQMPQVPGQPGGTPPVQQG